ncbi:MAG: VWA domain-containing protein [Gemmatimonadota bacterium]
MPVAVEFTRPLWLLLLPVLAAVLVLARLPWWRAALARRSATQKPLRAELARHAVRLAWLALPVLALAGLAITRSAHRLGVVFVVDGSASVASVRDQQEATVRTAIAGLRRGDVAGVVAIGDAAHVEEPLSDQPRFDQLTSAPGSATNLSAGLTLAAGIVPADRVGRIVLISDGRETVGDVVASARELAERGFTVDVIPVGPAAVTDVRLDRADVRGIAREGEASVLRIAVTSGKATTGALRVYRNDALVIDTEVRYRAGEQELALALPPAEPGMHRLRIEASAEGAADITPRNNVLGAVQRVLGAPRVLVVAGESGAGFLPAALQATGARVRVVPPTALPTDIATLAESDVIVFADVSASDLPEGAMPAVERHVRELGRGLIMTGGPDAFGPGGYAGTPIEKALPVDMDIRGRGREPRVALILVIDKSGSMQGMKMDLAKEAAARSVRLLNKDDQAGVIVFDSHPQWAARLARIGDGAWLDQAIGSIYAGGGTEIFPAVAGAFDALSNVKADVKHVIALTDGHSGSGGEYARLLEEMRSEHITLSTIAVGQDADAALLGALARAGRGRLHVAIDPARLPEVFLEETVMATRTILVDALFAPAAASASVLLQGIDKVPSLQGYVAVTPKARAEVVLVSHEGDPVLSAWQYGAGRAIAWTPDLGARWSGAWARHPAARQLWGNAVSWLLPPPDGGELTARVEHEPGGSVLIVENRSAWDEVRPTLAVIVGSEARTTEIAVAPAGPGQYRTVLPALEAGAYFVRVRQSLTSGGELHAEAGWAAPYSAEYKEIGVDTATLARIATAGNGRVLSDPLAAMREPDAPAVARWPLAPLLLVLAAITWPLEIASRRLPRPPLPAWLRRRRMRNVEDNQTERHPVRRVADDVAQPAEPGAAEGGAAPEDTTDRLLEHARSLRQRQPR